MSLSTSGLGSSVNVDIALSGNGPIASSDRVILTWRATRPGSSSPETFQLTHDVSTSDISRGTISINALTANYVTPYSNGGSIELSYTVFDGSTTLQKGSPSAKELVSVDAGASSLQAPYVLEASGSSIPANTATATLSIPPWAGMALGQVVTYQWAGTYSGGAPATPFTDSIQVSGFTLNNNINFDLNAREAVFPFDGGAVDVSYVVTGIGSSAPRHYSVGAQQALPAPVVTSATGNTVAPDGVASVRISYPGIKNADRISLLWQPYGTGSAPGQAYTVTHDVSGNEATSGAVTLTVPAAYINPYEGGRVEVSYSELASNRQSATANYSIGTAAGAGKVTSFVVEIPESGGPVSGNGEAFYQVRATVTDDRGVVVQGATVSFAGGIPGGGDGFSLSQGEDVTDSQGQARTQVRCSHPAVVDVLARCGSTTAQALNLTFEAVISGTTSAFTAQPQTIVADNQDEAVLTLTARSAEGNLMTGLAPRLSFILTGSGSVTQVQETPAGSGIYTASLRTGSAGSITVVPHLDGQPVAGLSAEVVAGSPMSALVNGYTFQATAGFPTSGFAQAKFQLLINGSAANNGQYAWSADQAWLTVDGAGNVTFLLKPDAAEKTVRIIARPVSGTPYAYKLTLDSWYINNGSIQINWSSANTWAQQQGDSLPTVQQLNGSTTHGNGVRGVRGGLWSEWGDVGKYGGSGFVSAGYWTSEVSSSGYHYDVNLVNGVVSIFSDTGNLSHVVCPQGL